MFKKFILILITLLLPIFTAPSSSCTCPESSSPPSTIKNKSSTTLTDIVIEGVNYGKPLLIGNLIFLTKTISVVRETASLVFTCPTGFRLPTKAELENMLSTLGSSASSTLSDSSGFNFQKDKYYMTNDKVYPSITETSLNEAWMFYGLAYSNNKYVIESVNSYWQNDYLIGRCVQDLSDVHLNIDGLTYDLLTNEKRTLTLDTSLVKGFLMRYDNKLYTNNKIEITNTERGCNILEVWANALNDQSIYSCEVFYTRPKLGNDNDATFTMDKVSILNNEYYTTRIRPIYFERPHAPIAPKYNGGYYVAFHDIKENYLRVVEYNSEDKVVNNNLLKDIPKAFPLDIIETDYGFAIYCRAVEDSNYAFLVTYTFDYVLRTTTTIMNNGKEGVERTDAISFHDSSGAAFYGLGYMYEPENGKLAYGRGNLNLIFAHYNNFGEDGGHTGDTYYIFGNMPSEKTTKYAWYWLTSHSNIQSHIYDGRYFVTAALGDAYPEGITLSIIDVMRSNYAFDSVRNDYPGIKYVTDDTICGTMAGDHAGNSMGRLAGVLSFDNFYVVVYSVKPTESETRNGIFLTKFTYENDKVNFVESFNILPNEAGKIKNVRCAKYGNKILITYIQNSSDYGDDYAPYYLDYTETMYYLVSDTNGMVTAGPFQADSQHEALSEDIRELKDGSLRWGYVDNRNVLRIVKVAAP